MMDLSHIRFVSVIDILMVLFIIYQLYKLIRGTAALNIFIAIILVYALYLIVKALKMELMTNILGQLTSAGVIALIVLFQQEIRRFLFYLSSKYVTGSRDTILRRFIQPKQKSTAFAQVIVDACCNMAATRTGALIVLKRTSSLQMYADTGDIINADLSGRLLENIFFKNSPLHDGAVLIANNRIQAARCVLPTNDNPDIPAYYGMRHRAAIGVTEVTDAIAVVVSEETGHISYVENGKIESHISPERLMNLLQNN
jgi:uncharacterized protein (TIGR00159 family)